MLGDSYLSALAPLQGSPVTRRVKRHYLWD